MLRFIFTVLHGVTVFASGRLLILSCSTFLHEPDAGAWKNSAYKNDSTSYQYSSMCALKWIASSSPMFTAPSLPRNTQFTSVLRLKASNGFDARVVDVRVEIQPICTNS